MKNKVEKSENLNTRIGKALKDTSYLLTIIFCALRGCDVITWSWVWVLSPILILETFALVLIFIGGLISFFISAEKNKDN